MDNEKKFNIIILYILYTLLFTEVLISSPEFLDYTGALKGFGICFALSLLIHLIAHGKLNILYIIGATVNYVGFGLLCSTYNTYLARKYDMGLIVLAAIAVVVLIVMVANVECLTSASRRTNRTLASMLVILMIASLIGWIFKDSVFCTYSFYYIFIAISCLYVCHTINDSSKNVCFEVSIGSFLLPVIVVKLLLDRKRNRI